MKLGVTLDILNQKDTPAFYADTLANRPAAGFTGRVFISTDTYDLYRDTGSTWVLLSPSSTGTITGSGAAGQIALWSGASSITGDSGLTYDSAANSLTADKFIVSGGTSSQFLKGDGSLDSNTYLTSSALTGYVPYTSATANVNLGSFDLTADLITGATGSFTSSGGSNTFGITHSSGSGIALNISKDGNGEGLIVTKGSGSGNAATINGGLVRIENNSNDAQLQIVSSIAPSLRIDNASTGATRRIGLGLATASNNFIQGTTGGELCLFNSSTTPSPILFGIYDTATLQTNEAGRVSSLLNFLLGQTTDTGEKLQVTGNVKITGTLSATSLGITGGTANTLLATNGSTISAGSNITISGGTISAASSTFTAGAGIDITGSVISSTITQYTDANARASLSFTAGSGAYNSSTGVITIPTNTNQLTNGSAFITLASLSAGSGISYNSSTGVISSTITQYTDANARASLSAGTGISYNSSTGVISATSSGGITGSGTTNKIPLFNSATSVTDSVISQSSGNLIIGGNFSSGIVTTIFNGVNVTAFNTATTQFTLPSNEYALYIFMIYSTSQNVFATGTISQLNTSVIATTTSGNNNFQISSSGYNIQITAFTFPATITIPITDIIVKLLKIS